MSRSAEELEIRVSVLLRFPLELRERCIDIARQQSPSAAFNLGAQAARLASLCQMEVLAVAKATRWLAIVRRDYGQESFESVVKTLTSNTTPTV